MERVLKGMSYADGRKTIAYDQVSNETLTRAVFNNQEGIVKIEEDLEKRKSLEDSRFNYLIRQIIHLEETLERRSKDLENRERNLQERLDRAEAFAEIVRRSGLFRFLNLFGKWVAYDGDQVIPLARNAGRRRFFERLLETRESRALPPPATEEINGRKDDEP